MKIFKELNRHIFTLLFFCVTSFPAYSQETIEVGFSPCWAGRACALDVVVNSIENAVPNEPLLMAAYGLTSKRIERALIEAHNKGVKVRVLADSKSNQSGSVTKHLEEAGIPVRLNDRYAIMHNKFIIIGSDVVETGSFNFTTAASTRNAENVLIIKGNPQLARQYRDEWNRLWDETD